MNIHTITNAWEILVEFIFKIAPLGVLVVAIRTALGFIGVDNYKEFRNISDFLEDLKGWIWSGIKWFVVILVIILVSLLLMEYFFSVSFQDVEKQVEKFFAEPTPSYYPTPQYQIAVPQNTPTIRQRSTLNPSPPPAYQPTVTIASAIPSRTISSVTILTRTTKTGMNQSLISAGQFNMGNDMENIQKLFVSCQRSRPEHENVDDCSRQVNQYLTNDVYLDVYWIDQTEVTKEQFIEFVENTGYDYEETQRVRESLPNEPITFVTWEDSKQFCEWRGGRLPTEAEWEKAARWNPNTNESYIYPWGNQFDGTNLNYCDAKCETVYPRDTRYDDGNPALSVVGYYKEGVSSYGVFDMAGNVWEWVADWYDEDYYLGEDIDDDVVLDNPTGAKSGQKKVARGGSFFGYADYAMSSHRLYLSPKHTSRDAGFRCVGEYVTESVTTPVVEREVKEGVMQVYVSEGEFVMGSDSDKQQDNPKHKVYLDAFWIDQTEVTNDQFNDFLSASGSNSDLTSQNLDNPVSNITWNEARDFCEWRGSQLPTEAQWEKAARWNQDMQKSTTYPWGNEPVNSKKLNFCDENCTQEWANVEIDDGYSESAPVKQYPAGVSLYGAFDMAGNITEWVADWYDEGFYSSDDAYYNPVKSECLQTECNDQRVVRGGSWLTGSDTVRSFARSKSQPERKDPHIGFRCANTESGK